MMKRFAIALAAALLLSLLALGCACAEPNVTPLSLGETATVTISQAGDMAYFSFTPTENGAYVFYGTPMDGKSYEDTFAEIYDAGMCYLTSDDDSGGNGQFRLTYIMTAGTTYNFGARYFNESKTGTFNVHLEPYSGLVSVSPVGGYEQYVPYNESSTLEVEALCTDGAQVTLSYQWEVYLYTPDEYGNFSSGGALQIENDSAQLAIGPVTQPAQYNCTVTDSLGNSKTVGIFVNVDNQLEVTLEGEQEKGVRPYGDVTVSVSASCLDDEVLYYHWSSSSDYDLSEESGPSCTLRDITGRSYFTCRVVDKYGNSDSVYFCVYVDNEFRLQYPGSGNHYEYKYVRPHSTVTLEADVGCIDWAGMTYVWEGPDGEIEGDMEEFYTLEDVTTPGDYWLYVSDKYGNSDSLHFYVGVDNQLKLERESEYSQTVTAGNSVTLSVSVDCIDDTDLTYRWDGPDGDIEDATDATLTFSPTRAGYYYCYVYDSYNNSDGTYFWVGIDNELSITYNSDYQTFVNQGENVTMEVTATCRDGQDELTYRWSGPGGMIEGATGPSYTAVNVMKAGYYYCEVTDKYSNYEGLSFLVGIANELSVQAVGGYSHPVVPGGDVTLEVAATCRDGQDQLIYEWRDDFGRTIEGVDGPTYSVANVMNSCRYWCIVTDIYGNTLGSDFRVWPNNQLTVTPVGDTERTVQFGDDVTLAVTATCANGQDELTYSWSDSNGTIDGATESSLTLEDVDQAGYYSCQVTDIYNNQEGVSFRINIENGLTVASALESVYLTVAPGGSATLAVTATCTSGQDELTYRWSNNNGTIDGETEPSCTLNGLYNTAEYMCTVTDKYGNHGYVSFWINIDNALTVALVGEQTKLVAPHGNVTLAFTVDGYDLEDLSCVWWGPNGQQITGVKGQSYTVTDVTHSGYYSFSAVDKYNNYRGSYFYVKVDNALKMERVTDFEVPVEPGGSATLTVSVTGNDLTGLTYRWAYWEDEDNEIVLDETGPSLSLTDITSSINYNCSATDAYGNTVGVNFWVSIDNALTVTCDGDSSITVNPHDDAELAVTVTANNLEGLTYRWEDDDEHVIEGATGPSCTIEDVTNEGTYYCYVTDVYGNSEYAQFYVDIDNELSVTRVGDRYRWVSPGTTQTMTVEVDCVDDSGVAICWYGPDGLINNATEPSYTVESVSRAGNYACIVTDPYGGYYSIPFSISINNRLIAYRVGDYDRGVAPGATETLAVTVSCDDAEGLTYRWGFNANSSTTIIEGATEASYTLPADAAKNTYYYCYVTDRFNNSTSVTFWVYRDNGLFVENASDYYVKVAPNGTATMTVRAGCTVGDCHLQWYHETDDGNVAIEGETGTTLTVSGIQQSGWYYCTATDDYGSSRTAEFHVVIDSGLYAKHVGSSNVRVPLGGSVTLAVDAGCDVGTPTFQWYSGEYDDEMDPIEGETESTLTLENVQRGRYYKCRVYDAYGSWETVYYHVYANNFSVSRVGPRDVYVDEGDSVTLAVRARCSEGELFYEWEDPDGDTIEGATGSTLTVPSVTYSGEYRCHVSDEYDNYKTIYYDVNLNYSLTAYPLSSRVIVAGVGAVLNFRVYAESTVGGLTYEWRAYPSGDSYNDEDYTVIEGANGSTYQLAVTADCAPLYVCRVTDANNCWENVEFTVQLLTGSPKALTLDQTVQANITTAGRLAFFSFKPTVTASYTFFSSLNNGDTCGYLYDSAWKLIADNDDIDDDNYNFSITQVLEANKTYYFGARFYNRTRTGEFPVTLITQDETQEAFVTLTAPTSVQVGEELTLVIESDGIKGLDLYAVEDDGSRNSLDWWWYDEYDNLLYYSDTWYAPQTLTFIAEGALGSSRYVDSEEITVNVTSNGTLAQPTLSVSCDDDGAQITYALPDNANSIRIRTTFGGVQREFWSTKSGTLTLDSDGLSIGQHGVQVEATAFGIGYLESTATAAGSVIVHAQDRMVLPAGLLVIGDQAFADLPAEEVVIQSGCTTIGSEAFAGCDELKLVIMPDSVTSIAPDAFDGCTVTFVCQSQNVAAAYASQHDNISFVIQ